MSTPRKRLSASTISAAAITAAKIAGCTCDPDVDLTDDSGILHATVRHDDWCPIIQRSAARWN